MAESQEYRAVVSCLKQLETALFKCDRDVTHFLLQEGFITAEAHHEVLSPGSIWTAHQKAGVLVSGIMKKVALSAQGYHILVDHLRQSGKYYESIVAILNKEYTRQQQDDLMPEHDHLRSVPRIVGALSRYKEYLKAYYKSYSVALDDKLFIAPCSEFISLALIKKEKYFCYDNFTKSILRGGVDDNVTQYFLHDRVDEILASKTPLEMDALVTPDSRLVLVEGPPGIGKSTLCWELCRKWDTLKSLQNFCIVLLLKLREDRIQNASKLEDLFYHEDEKLSQRVTAEVLECEGKGVLLVLDGFDEMPTSVVRNKNNLIMKLINAQCMPKATCIVTSRPSALNKLYFKCRHVKILGFTDDSKINYAKMAFENNYEIFTDFKSFIFSNPVTNSLLYIPINCAIIVQVYQEIGSSGNMIVPKTMTQLYTILVLVLIRRHMIALEKCDEDSEIPSKLEELPKDILTNLLRVSELAYKGLFAEDIQVVFSTHDVGRDFNHLGLMSVSREMYVASGTKVTYSFFHLSMQEFLAAWYASKPIKDQPITLGGFFHLETYAEVPLHLHGYEKFLAGFVGLTKFISDPLAPFDLSTSKLFLHCFFEAQNLTHRTRGSFRSIRGRSVDISNSLEGYVLGYYLTHVRNDFKLSATIQDFHALLTSLHCHSKSLPIRGTNTHLELIAEINGYFSPTLDEVSLGFLRLVSAVELKVEDFCSIEGVVLILSAMCNLSTLKVTIVNDAQHCQNDYVLFKALESLHNLKTVEFVFQGYIISDMGVNDLKNFFRSSSSVETVKLSFQNVLQDFDETTCTFTKTTLVFGNDYHPIIESVLACPTLTSFTTDIPFVTSKFPSNLKNVRFNLPGGREVAYGDWNSSLHTLSSINRCIFCITNLCANSSVETFTFDANHSENPKIFCKLLSILNLSLCSNHSDFQIDVRNFSCANLLSNTSVLSRSLQRSFESKRSESLCNLTGIPELEQSIASKAHSYFGGRLGRKSYSKTVSCPDLSDLQRLRTLHPQLYEKPFKYVSRVKYIKYKHY